MLLDVRSPDDKFVATYYRGGVNDLNVEVREVGLSVGEPIYSTEPSCVTSPKSDLCLS